MASRQARHSFVCTAPAALRRRSQQITYPTSTSSTSFYERHDTDPAARMHSQQRTYLTAISSTSFYERLGSPKHILAPMVAQSDLPFRLMCEQLYNVDLSYTQMIHASNFADVNGEPFRTNHLDVYEHSLVRDVLLGDNARRRGEVIVMPSQVNAIEGLDESDVDAARDRVLTALKNASSSNQMPSIKPTVVQIAAHDPDVAVEAALMILEKSESTGSSVNGSISPVVAFDLNLGCPQGIARKGKYGAFLHDEYPQSAYDVLIKLRAMLPREIGVTAKVRLPPTKADAEAGKLGNMSELSHLPTPEERIQRLIDCGVDLITVHGRTRFENKVAVGKADWNSIERCVQTARVYSGNAQYPLIANGGIETYNDVERCLDQTQASGVMSSESLLENPGLFSNLSEETACDTLARGMLERQLGYACMYLDYATLFPPIPGSLGARGGCFNVIRTHLFKILHRYLEENPDLRSLLGDNGALNTMKQGRELVQELRSRYSKLDEEQLRLKSSWNNDSSWYRRHRNQQYGLGFNADSPFTSVDVNSITIEEKKQRAKLRIQQMKEQRLKRDEDTKIAA